MSRQPFLSWLLAPRRFGPQRVLRAAQAFVQIEASSGIVLLAAAVVALVWANSAWDGAYFDLWQTRLVVDTGLFSIDEDLQHWVNDGLMTVFFFLAGLEIKRELVQGELSTPRRALLPAAAALGGMIAPALIYTALNAGTPGADGWGIPMATDIAFALGVLSLLGNRIPFSIKIFLLALAIADDIGAVLVIAFFYTEAIALDALAIAALMLVAIVALSRLGVRSLGIYVVIGVALWLAVYESGIHATLAGVALGLLTPARPYSRSPDLESSEGMESPLDSLERKLHPWVGYLIVPVFALANAGVAISGSVVSDAVASSVSRGVILGLLLGKPLGIFVFTWLAVRLRLCELPAGSTWAHIFGAGLLGGIGFTVSLLITGLAFADAALVGEAKLGVLSASVIAGCVGLLFLWLTARRLNNRTGSDEAASGA